MYFLVRLGGLPLCIAGGIEPVKQDQWSESEVGASEEVARVALSVGVVSQLV